MEDRKIFEKMLSKEYKLYPRMQIQDMIKLIYQNEFAGAHMIENQQDSLNMIKKETEVLRKKYSDNFVPVDFKKMGNNLSRVCFSENNINEKLSIETINNFFVNTANSESGNIENFEKKLKIFESWYQKNFSPFLVDKLEIYLRQYKLKSYPSVSHSREYKKAYSPSYRVVKDEYRHYFDIFQKIDYLLKHKDNIKIAIDGNSASGKSTLAEIIEEVYECNVFHMDDFFLRNEQRTQKRLQEIGGNIDYERFDHEIMKGLNEGIEFEYSPYNCKTSALEQSVLVEPKKLNIIEGVYSMHPMLVENYDLKIYIGIDVKKQKNRILKRNGIVMHKRFVNEWIPMENEYFDKMNILSKGDIVYPGYIVV